MDDLLRNEHYAVNLAHMKQRKTEMDFPEDLYNISPRCCFHNAELVNCFKNVITDSTRRLLLNNVRGL